ncbi:MAG: hypothetical protein MZV63_36990 [Marinilabiliales bacterium]|nr:hypothetical protein [Marinilabiliales bacterium]
MKKLLPMMLMMALGKVLTEMTPEEAIKIIKDSGLRGRGGGGFPTGFEMGTCQKEQLG